MSRMKGEPHSACAVARIDQPGRMAPMKARPTIESVVSEIRRVAGGIGSLPVTSTRDALLWELNQIADAVVDLAARLDAKKAKTR